MSGLLAQPSPLLLVWLVAALPSHYWHVERLCVGGGGWAVEVEKASTALAALCWEECWPYDLAESRKSWGPWATWEELCGAVHFVASHGLSQCSWVAVHFSCTSALNSPAYCLLLVRNLFSSLPKRAPCVIGRSWGKYVCVSLIECGRECVSECVYVGCWSADTLQTSTLVIATWTKVQTKTILKNDKLFC